jgi:hypothetical protein
VAVMIWVVNEFHLVSKLAISLSSKSLWMKRKTDKATMTRNDFVFDRFPMIISIVQQISLPKNTNFEFSTVRLGMCVCECESFVLSGQRKIENKFEIWCSGLCVREVLCVCVCCPCLCVNKKKNVCVCVCYLANAKKNTNNNTSATPNRSVRS